MGQGDVISAQAEPRQRGSTRDGNNCHCASLEKSEQKFSGVVLISQLTGLSGEINHKLFIFFPQLQIFPNFAVYIIKIKTILF